MASLLSTIYFYSSEMFKIIFPCLYARSSLKILKNTNKYQIEGGWGGCGYIQYL